MFFGATYWLQLNRRNVTRVWIITRLSENFTFQAVAKNKHRHSLWRNGFTYVISPTTIRQLLLGEYILTIDTHFKKALSLGIRSKNLDASVLHDTSVLLVIVVM